MVVSGIVGGIKTIAASVIGGVGLTIGSGGRASNLLWRSFGDKVVTSDRKGNAILKRKYALHVQCAWRLTQNNRIIVGSKDVSIGTRYRTWHRIKHYLQYI